MKTTLRILLVIAVLIPTMKAKAQTNNSLIPTATFELKNTCSSKLRYLIYLPQGYNQTTNKCWPLMLFLHGVGERGTNIQSVAIHGPLSLVKQGTNFPFIIVAPQCPADEPWDDQPLLKLLDHVTEKYPVDTNRVYLTGLSMGGYAAWKLGLAHPERFAALAPVCGGVSLIDTYMAKHDRVEAIKHLPIWAFHGAKDDVFSPDESARAITELKQHGVRDVKLTVFPETKHDSWKQAYADPELYQWLLKQSR